MESAIPAHLQCPRSRARRIDDDYQPPYPAWTARPDPALQRVVMGYFGVQSKGPAQDALARIAFRTVVDSFAAADGPGHVDQTYERDAEGYDIHLAIAYWSDPETFARWQASPAVADWWNSDERLAEGVGYFREILTPRVERFETLFASPDVLEGVGMVLDKRSVDPVQEHGYWGSMRDRFPLSQTDAMESSGNLIALPSSRRVRIAGHSNVAVIRSGQDWRDTEGRERELYLREMEPILRKGMMFLRDHGCEIGCYANRYVQHIDPSMGLVEKSFAVSYWNSLEKMEQWAEFHPTHEAIFGKFMEIVGVLELDLKLRLYHEVSVLTPEEQSYEYINCHPRTGLLATALP